MGELQPANLDLELVRQEADGCLDVAGRALRSAGTFTGEMQRLHPQIFPSDPPIGPEDLQALAQYGTQLITAGVKGAEGGRRLHLPRLPRRLWHLVTDYHGRAGADIEPPSPEQIVEQTEIITEATRPSTDRAGLASLLERLDASVEGTPSEADIAAMIGLAAVHLTPFFLPEAARVDPLRNVAPASHDEPPDYRAGALVVVYLSNGRDEDIVTRELKGALSQQAIDAPFVDERIASLMSELRSADALVKRLAPYKDIYRAYGAIILQSLHGAARQIDSLRGQLAAADEDPAAHEDHTRVTLEDELVALGGPLIRQASVLLRAAEDPCRAAVEAAPELGLPRFEALTTPLRDRLRRLAAEEAGRLATVRRAEEAASRKEAEAALAELRSRYIMSGAARRRYDKANDTNSAALTGLLIGGELGEAGDDPDRAKPLTEKEDVNAVAGLAYRLDELLQKARPEDSAAIFAELVGAVDREVVLSTRINEPEGARVLSRAYEWLVDNGVYAQVSGEKGAEVLKRVSYALDEYRSGKLARDSSLAEKRRVLTPRTTAALLDLDLRLEAQPLDIVAFPPGEGKSSAEGLLEDLEGVLAKLAPRHRISRREVQWERLWELGVLADELRASGRFANIEVFRLLPGTLKEPFPYYAVTMETADGRKLVIAENPVKDNATYVFEEIDPEFVTWQQIVQLDRPSACELGARRMVHNARNTIQTHYRRVRDELTFRLSQAR